jgi:hypothetical protein
VKKPPDEVQGGFFALTRCQLPKARPVGMRRVPLKTSERLVAELVHATGYSAAL